MATPGTGSLWNPNSWHWETRTYTKWSEEHLRNALLNQCATHGPLAVKVTGVPTLVLDASVNIRKGRKFVVWELAKLTVDWKGYAPSGAVDRVTTGTLSLEFGGIMHDDVATDFPMRMTHTGTTAYDTTCRDIARAKLAPLVREAIRQWCAALAAHDDVLEAQAIAYRDREKAAEVASEVQLPSPAPKPVLVPVTASVPAKAATTVEEKLAQLLVSEPNSASNSNSSGNDLLAATKVEEPLAVSPAAHAAPKSAPTPSEGSSASVRNPDSFLWEERSLTSWAKARLSELIGGIDIDVPGGSIKIVETKLKGDASVSLRRVSRACWPHLPSMPALGGALPRGG